MWTCAAVLTFSGCGGGSDGGAETRGQSEPATDGEPGDSLATQLFSNLEPASGDVLVLPKIGFRWDADSLTVARLAGPGQGRYRVTVTDSLGAVYGRSTVEGRAAWIELPPTTAPGKYLWQVELLSSTDNSIRARSPAESFLIR